MLRNYLEEKPDRNRVTYSILLLLRLFNQGYRDDELINEYTIQMDKVGRWKSEITRKDFTKFVMNYLIELQYIKGERLSSKTPSKKVKRSKSKKHFDIIPQFVHGKLYKRSELHDKYGGQRQSGIATPRNYNIIMLFTGDVGREYGYEDRWTDDGIFFYSGEGIGRDMEFSRGNKAIVNHSYTGKDLHVFEKGKKGYVKYTGSMIYSGHQIKDVDSKGEKRQVILFELVPIELFQNDETKSIEEIENNLDRLRKKALQDSSDTSESSQRMVNVWKRSISVKKYILERANGKCEYCKSDAPFEKPNGAKFLEHHHIYRVSDGGPDDPRYVAGLCPNCHREAHYGARAKIINDDLIEIVNHIEKTRARKSSG